MNDTELVSDIFGFLKENPQGLRCKRVGIKKLDGHNAKPTIGSCYIEQGKILKTVNVTGCNFC